MKGKRNETRLINERRYDMIKERSTKTQNKIKRKKKIKRGIDENVKKMKLLIKKEMKKSKFEES